MMKQFFMVLTVLVVFVLLPSLFIVSVVMHGCSTTAGLANNAMDVVAKQVDPSVMLRKYEWFKDASAMCDRKLADISVYEKRLSSLKHEYAGKSRNEWAREDREQYNIWLSEISGIQASYNALAAEYNANMAKVNYAFCNVGSLPRGAENPLPKEFKPYIGEE